MKKVKLDTYLTSQTKINSKWTKKKNHKQVILKMKSFKTQKKI